MLDMLAALWYQYPDLRLGQLVYNLTYGHNQFNIEDNDLLEIIHNRVLEGF